MVTLGGLFLSLACAVFLEEMLVGGLFRLFFVSRPEAQDKRGSGRVR
jgi:hypothetical protein